MICVISQINFITGSNPKFIKIGFFVVKDVGILFLNIMTILMEGQESQTDKSSSKLKFSITKKLIYSLSILSFLLIFGFVLLFISSSKKSASNSFIILEKEF